MNGAWLQYSIAGGRLSGFIETKSGTTSQFHRISMSATGALPTGTYEIRVADGADEWLMLRPMGHSVAGPGELAIRNREEGKDGGIVLGSGNYDELEDLLHHVPIKPAVGRLMATP